MLVCVLFWGWGYGFHYNSCLDIPCPQPHLLFPNTNVRAFAAIIRILSASPFNARNNCWGGWGRRSARVPWSPLESLFSSLGQLAERVCRFPQVELITVANWDLSGSRGRNELMEVGRAFLTLWAWLEISVQETCGHYLITKCFFDLRLPWAHWKTPDGWNGVIIWVMQAHVTCRHKRNPNICTNAWCGLLLTIRAAEDSPIHHGGADLGTIARSGWVMGTEEISLTHFTDGKLSLGTADYFVWDLYPDSYPPLKPCSLHLITDSLNGSLGVSPPLRISFLLHFINISTIWRISRVLQVCFHERWF